METDLHDVFKLISGSAYIKINLDAVTKNVNILRSSVSNRTGVIGVVKGGCYGHGGIPVSRHLKSLGVEELAVATIGEGRSLRQAGISGKIHVLANMLPEEFDAAMKYDLIPTVCWDRSLKAVGKENLQHKNGNRLKVNIKVDSGMGRYGVQSEDLDDLVQSLDAMDVGIEGIFTHLAGGIMDQEGNGKQLDVFLEATDPYCGKNIVRHIAATTGVCQEFGTDLDFIRPGGSLYGMCSCNDLPGSKIFQDKGFQPAMSVIAKPTFYKLLGKGRTVGYDRTYATEKKEWIANLATGWSDGVKRLLSGELGAVKCNRTGDLCPVVGRVSMDSLTIRLNNPQQGNDTFSVITDDYSEKTSIAAIARLVGGANYEMAGMWSTRLPRVYFKNGQLVEIMHAIDYCN